MDAERELLYICEFVAKLVDSQLWVWNTTVEPRLWVRLVFAVPVASSWTTTHGDCKEKKSAGRGEEGVSTISSANSVKMGAVVARGSKGVEQLQPCFGLVVLGPSRLARNTLASTK